MTCDAVGNAGGAITIIEAVIVAIAGDSWSDSIAMQTRERIVSGITVNSMALYAANTRGRNSNVPVRLDGAAGVTARGVTSRGKATV